MAQVKHMGFVTRREDLGWEEFIDHWMSRHAPMVSRLPGLLRYSVNVIDRGRFPELGFDGFSELWFASEEALDAALASPEGREVLADVSSFVGHRMAVRVVEHQVV